MNEKIHTIKTSRGELRYWYNFDEMDGAIIMENPHTIKRYKEINQEHPDAAAHGVFFAFSDEQFTKGYNDALQRGLIADGEKIVDAGAGMFGTSKCLDAYFEAYKARDKVVAAECDPQEIYFYEYNNHECQIGFEGDAPAFRIIKRIFGEAVANSVHRVGI